MPLILEERVVGLLDLQFADQPDEAVIADMARRFADRLSSGAQ